MIMLKGRLISPVIIGRISIGESIERDGQLIPRPMDEFNITSTVQENGKWIDHEITSEYTQDAKDAKLRSIPVRLMFDSPDNNFRSGYACFSEGGRQICASSGNKAIRLVKNVGKQEFECQTPEFCEFGINHGCKLLGRLLVSIEPQFHKDPLAGFAYRTTGYNSVNALASRLNQYSALTNGRMAGMPCNLVLRAKSTSASYRQAIFYVDLEPRESLFSAVAEANKYHQSCEENGVNLNALDKAVSACYAGTPYIEDETEEKFIAKGVLLTFESKE
jgi:hypothetical protein